MPRNPPTRTHVRKSRDERKAEMLAAAIKIAEASGLATLTRAAVARVVSVTPALINSYFQGVDGLIWETVVEAGRTKNLRVLAGALEIYDQSHVEGVSSKALVAQAKKLAAV